MLTQCPSCGAIYRVNASELSSARGFVECGDCHEQFNALDRIADEPTFAAATETEAQQTAGDTSTFVLLDTSADASAADDGRASETMPRVAEHDDSLDSTDELAVFVADAGAADRPDSTASQQTLPPEDHAILFTEPERDGDIESAPTRDESVPAHIGIKVDDGDLDLEDVPPILQDEVIAMAQPRGRRTRWVWSSVALLLMALLSAQLAWRYREVLLKEMPELKPHAERVCAALGCTVIQPVDVEPIQLLSRDVRDHPRYEDALLVNATIINMTEQTTAFPEIQLGLYDQTGTPIGVRRFAPSEYLDQSIDRESGLPAGKTVHVVLEVAAASDRAVSFEFSFF